MKRYLFLALAWAAVAGFATSDASARGGHGGGHHGGGHHGGGHHGGHHSHHTHHGHHDHHHTHTHHHVGHHSGNHAFGHGWNGYGRGAWGWGAGGYAWGNPWGAASWGTTAAWLGLPAVAAGVNSIAQPVYSGAVAATESGTNETATPDSQAVVADTNLDNNSDDNNGDEGADDADAPIEQPAAATALAASGVAEPAAQAKFLPLGVYTIAPEGETEAVAILHLAVSKEGIVRGTYHDLKTDKDENIRGAVDKKEHSIAWTIGGGGKTIFHTWLEDLTEQSGPVTEKTADGQTRVLTIARYTEDDAKQDGIGAPAEAKTK